MQSVVVTGVSTGIGWGITKVLIKRGFRVFGSAAVNPCALKQRGIETASGVVTSCLGLYGDGLYIKPRRPQGLRGRERLINSQ